MSARDAARTAELKQLCHDFAAYRMVCAQTRREAQEGRASSRRTVAWSRRQRD